ncbi:O-antigen/teichoic acid export membrane protein [Microbacteriaceae bacterium SG_E_30_P1]|uniref:O-antigen/teichoic acid export membrane protein n=1 Tax=Antiquaquibacter oligotrophicus TaxID=2880260 RepID=A0ABT6KPA0_9MICO|nr:hypothetical protein [Antiquaquibacter oligotrophicus]MDH6181684.1 O-antigen/teichoic acid export membrane protein [Antiquaquibacter oligotrophicus]UDF12632.1 hypothetical protein LH407_10770 [Antiquaquibacter oligotrophicus]
MIAKLLGQNLMRAGIASTWVLAARLLGLAWTALIIFRLGLADYGVYAIAFAVAAIIAAPIDNIFLVRSLRIDDESYGREAATRVLVGGALLLLGVVFFVPVFVVGFALVVAGGEILFNAVKGDALRAGLPNIVTRLDALRQLSSIVLASVYLFTVNNPSLELAVGLYSAPYLVIAIAAAIKVRGRRPKMPGSFHEIRLLWFDALALALYLQADVILLGVLTTEEIAGVYSLASVVALALSSFAQMFAQTFHERLRAGLGDPDAGPRRVASLAVAILLAIAMLVVGLVLMAFFSEPGVGLLFVVMSTVVLLRSLTLILTTMLYVQGRDGHRVAAGWTAAAVKLGILALLAPLGALGAAVGAIAGELILLIWYYRVVYSWSPQVRPEKRADDAPIVPDGGGLL